MHNEVLAMLRRNPKVNPTIRHVLESPCLFKTAPRLDMYMTPEVYTITYDDLAFILGSIADGNTLFFPDMCFLNGPEVPDAVWDQILGRRLVISPYIGREMREWLPDPFRDKRIAAAIRDAVGGAENGVILDEQVEIPEYQHYGRIYYVTLLGYRKSQVRDLVKKFEGEHGRKPDEDELDRLLKRNSISKDRQLLVKGAQELARGAHFFSDEDLVVTAGIGSLADGSHSVILTRDRDVLEQFNKFANLITTQYFSMLFAERYTSAPGEFDARPLPTGIPTIDAYFSAGDGQMVRKPVSDPDRFVGWILPEEVNQVKMTCILVGGNSPELKFSMISFNAERDMYRLIATKGKTRGMNTDRLGGRNCHVTGFPIGVPDPREHVLIVRDRTRPTEGGDMQVSELDIGHAIHNFIIRSEPSLPQAEPAAS